MRFTGSRQESFLIAGRQDDPAMIAPTHPARFYGSRRSAIELPGGVNDSSCHEKVDYSCFSALCSGDGAGFLRERFRR
jgi:hypothetical protein